MYISAVYRMDEIINVVSRDPKNIADAVDCLEQRLQFRSAVVKQKTLRLIKHIAQHGSGEFRRGLLRLSPVIRDLTHFTCAPDPFKGNIPWKRVQEGAREAMKVIHGDDESLDRGGISSHRMDGFGRTGEFSGRGILDAPSSGSGIDFFSAAGMVSGAFSTGERRMGGGPSYERPRIDSMGIGMRGAIVGDDVQRQQRSTEEKVIHTFCTPKQHGARIAPSMEECKSFRSDIAALNGRLLAVQLEKEIQHGDWKGCLRALCALESISENEQNSTESEILEYFRKNAESLKKVENSAQDRVRTKSLSVMSRIGLAQSQVDATGPDLLTIDNTMGNSSGVKPIEDELNALSVLEPLDHQEQPTSPVAGLVFSDTMTHESNGGKSDPFGDWEAGDSPEPVQTSLDPFQGLYGDSTDCAATSHTTPPSAPILDDFFTSIPNQTSNSSMFASTFEKSADTTIRNQSGMGTDAGITGMQSPSVLGACHAMTSGFTGSQAREESAFNFVQSTMESERKK